MITPLVGFNGRYALVNSDGGLMGVLFGEEADGWGETIVTEFLEELGRQKPGPGCPINGTHVLLVGGAE